MQDYRTIGLGISEAARVAGIPEYYLRRLIHQGVAKASRLGERGRFIVRIEEAERLRAEFATPKAVVR